MVEYTTTDKTITTMDIDFIRDAKLAVHGSTGAQLFGYSGDMLPVLNKIYLFPLNVGDGEFTCSTNVGKTYNNNAAYLFIVGGHLNTSEGVTTWGDGVWNGNNKTVESVNGYITILARKNSNTNPFEGYENMLNKGNIALPFEPYTGGTPYTDKYTATIKDQTESEVTLSIENVSASVGDNTELDVVLTDKNGITQRSEVGKTFIGGGQS